MELVFFGSGPVAKKCLELLSKNFKIEAIITKESTLQMMSEVLPNTPTFCVKNKLELDDLISSKNFNSSIGVLIDFGIIVSKGVIEKFAYGIVNSHFSRLPEWRGADPITFSLLSGQKTSGVTLMLIDEGMDTGKILVQKSIPINNNDSIEFTERLIKLSNDLLNQYLPAYVNGSIKPRQQPHPDRATYSSKLTKLDGKIDWNKSADLIEREIRAYIEWPKSYTKLGSLDVIIKKAKVINQKGNPGELASPNKNDLVVYCGENALLIEEVQPAGKKVMSTKDFLLGYRSKIFS